MARHSDRIRTKNPRLLASSPPVMATRNGTASVMAETLVSAGLSLRISSSESASLALTSFFGCFANVLENPLRATRKHPTVYDMNFSRFGFGVGPAFDG